MQPAIPTLGIQTSLFGMDELIYSQEVSPASRIVQPGNDLAKTTLDTSGQKCLEQFDRFDRVGSWAKTFAGLLIGMEGWYSTRCSLTWKLKATKSSRFYFQLAPSTPRIEGIGFGLLPTVQTQGLKVCDDQGKTQFMNLALLPTPRVSDTNSGRTLIPGTQNNFIRTNASGTKRMGANLSDVAGLLPTPTVMYTRENWTIEEIQKKQAEVKEKTNSKAGGAKTGNGFGLNLAQVAKMMPTPTASDYRSGMQNKTGGVHNQSLNDRVALEAGKTSQLNPQFVLEMMGFPVDWTLLPFLSGSGENHLPDGAKNP